MKITKFGSHTFGLAGVRDSFGGLETASGAVMTPYGPVDVIGSDPLDFGSDLLTKQLDLLAATPAALATVLDAVRALRGEYDTLTIEDYAGNERTAQARCRNVQYNRTARNFNMQTVLLIFEVLNNLWNGDATDSSVGKTTGQTEVINNGGNANVDDLRIEITAPAGNPISDVRVRETSNINIYTLFSGTVAANTTLILDAGEWLVTNDGADGWSDFSFEPSHAIDNMFRLLPGNNTYELTFSGGGTATFRYLFNDKWK